MVSRQHAQPGLAASRARSSLPASTYTPSPRMASCPHCGSTTDARARACPKCGVILAKVGGISLGLPSGDAAKAEAPVSRTRPAPAPPRAIRRPSVKPTVSAEPDHGNEGPAGKALVKVGIAAAAGLGLMLLVNPRRGAPASPAPPVSAELRPTPHPDAPEPAPVAATPEPSLMEAITVPRNGLSEEDVKFLDALVKAMQASPARLAEADLGRVKAMAEKVPDHASIRAVLVEGYLRKAGSQMAQRQFSEAASVLDLIKRIDPNEAKVYEFETSLRLQLGDWKGAEQSARKFESMAGARSAQVALQLAMAVSRLDQVDEALSILNRPLFEPCEGGSTSAEFLVVCPQARDLRTQLGKLHTAQAGKGMLQSERFAVRFDGETQMGVARDVLFVLDRAYARLAEIYNHRPATKIPVILHSGEDYYEKTGAPRWSGGQYSSHDGNIQIPIRGLSSNLPRDMEDTLVHELSHAFADDMSGGLIPRDLNEGLAQYMEGQRFESVLGPSELRRLANTRRVDVMSFYMLSLVVSQQLVQSRGQGPINDMLRGMRETGSADGGFKKVYGSGYEALKKDILETFWRRYS